MGHPMASPRTGDGAILIYEPMPRRLVACGETPAWVYWYARLSVEPEGTAAHIPP
jgi:hypothetical protein